jgi:hypothetical protein
MPDNNTCERVSSLLPADVKRRVMMDRCPACRTTCCGMEDGGGRRGRKTWTLTSRTELCNPSPRRKGDLPDLRSGLHTSPLYYKVAPNIHNSRLTRTLYCETNQPLALADMSKVTTSCTSHNRSSCVQSTENGIRHEHEPSNACASSGQSTKEMG